MTILQLIERAAGLSGPELVKLLQYIITNAPDLAPIATQWLQKLDSAIDPVNLAGVGLDVTKELQDVFQGKLSGQFHPGDLA